MATRPKSLSNITWVHTFIVAAVLAYTPVAIASSCCFSASGLQSARLKMWETVAMGLMTGVSVYIGTWTANGDFTFSDADEYQEVGLRSTLWTLYRPAWRHTVSTSIPLVWTFRTAGPQTDDGGGVGDVTVGYRYDLTTIGEYTDLPALAITVGLVLPSGRSPDAAQQPLGADGTGKGAVVPSVGFVVEDTVYPWFWRADLDIRTPLTAYRADLKTSQTQGVGVSATVTVGVDAIPNDLLISLGLSTLWESPIQLDGETVPDSMTQELTLHTSIAWRVHRNWTLQAGVDTGIFVSGLGTNRPGLVTSTFGFRFGG